MKIKRIGAGTAALAVAALALAACSNTPTDSETTPSGSGEATEATTEEGEPTTGGTLTVSETNEFFSFNPSTANGNTDINSKISLATSSSFYFIDADLQVQRDESFGTIEQISEDPLVVKYTVNEGQAWSDGEPIDADDLILAWAVFSGYYDDAATADDGTETGNSYFSYAGSTLGLGLTEFPEIGDDGRSITLTYSKPFSDWEVAFTLDRPAHVVAKGGGLADGQALVDLLQGLPRGDVAAPAAENAELRAVANFYNEGFDSRTLPSDPSLYLSSGPYIVSDVVEATSITLVPNEAYTGDLTGKLDQIIVRTIADPSAAIQALANGEVDVVSPQANADTLTAMEAVSGATVHKGLQLAFDHIDLNSTGVFENPLVREAFLKTIPREAILDAVITPLAPDATVLDSVLFVPAQDGYTDTAAANSFKDFTTPDIEGAKALLAEAGVTSPTVRILYNSNNPNRVDAYTLIAASATEAGFVIDDQGDPKWGSRLGDGSYDASIFGWINSGVGVSGVPQIYGTGQASNFNGVSSPEADTLMDTLITTIDPAKQVELQVEIESLLANTYTTLPFFQSVGADAVSDRVVGIDVYNPNQNGVWWNVSDWAVNDG